jgi:membrane protein DedA with SNARE-associated domain
MLQRAPFAIAVRVASRFRNRYEQWQNLSLKKGWGPTTSEAQVLSNMAGEKGRLGRPGLLPAVAYTLIVAMNAGRPDARAQGWDALRRRIDDLPRPLQLGAAAALLLALMAGLAMLPLLLATDQDDLERLGYLGVFVANFIGSANLFVPAPGLSAAGQALIVASSKTLNPWVVALVGGAGMSLAETTAYVAGRIGRRVSERHHLPIRGRLGRVLRWAAALVERLMLRWGFLTLLVLSAVPNPVFEFAGISAGAVRMSFWRFLLPVAIGKTLRAFLLVFLGSQFWG